MAQPPNWRFSSEAPGDNFSHLRPAERFSTSAAPSPLHVRRQSTTEPATRPSALWNQLGQAQQNRTPERPQALASVSPPPPPPPLHRYPVSSTSARRPSLTGPPTVDRRAFRRQSTTTPGAENLGQSAPGGGVVGVAVNIADAHPRASGIQALRDIDSLFAGGRAGFDDTHYVPEERKMDPPYEMDPRYAHHDVPYELQPRPPHARQQPSYGSGDPFGDADYPAPPTPTHGTYRAYSPHLSPQHSPARDPRGGSEYYSGYDARDPSPFYSDNPYNRYTSSANQGAIGGIDPNAIADDGDDGLEAPPHQRRSMLGIHRPYSHNNRSHDAIEAVGIPAAATGAAVGAGALGRAIASRDASGQYGHVPGSVQPEKSAWLSQQTTGNKKLKWMVGIGIVVVILLAAAGGVVGGILAHKNSSSSSNSSGSSSNSDPATASTGDYDVNTPQVKSLMNNPNLKKVFPGIDYTPLNAQYPACIETPPNQNNITMDVAVMSQLSNNVRLYGTDCNQTAMVLHAFSQLNLQPSDMKLWAGIWLENNQTTNDRQIAQFWDLVDNTSNAGDVLAGVIVGNEVLYRQDMSESDLVTYITSVKQNLTSKNLNIPVATSDLGDNWNASLASAVDIVMANVHPFFAGVTPDVASDWTWNFWQTHDVILTGIEPATYSPTNVSGAWTSSHKGQVISEVGWPSQGGNDCGTGAACPDATSGSVAGIDELNTFMAQFVCDALTNGTTYFWFEAFDEPWKIMYDTADDGWEDHWGLFDVNRNLKSNVTIPDCNGQRAPGA